MYKKCSILQETETRTTDNTTPKPDPAAVLKEVKAEIFNIYSGLAGEYFQGLNDGLDVVVKIIDAKIKELEG